MLKAATGVGVDNRHSQTGSTVDAFGLRKTVAHARIVEPSAGDGADARRHNRHPPPAVAAVNTSPPQPATAVNRRGPKSRAGLMAYPVLKPKLAPIATTSRPTITGVRPAGAGELRRVGDAEDDAHQQPGADRFVDEADGDVVNGCG